MFKRKKHNWTIPEGQEPTAFDKKILSYQNQGFLVPTRKLIKRQNKLKESNNPALSTLVYWTS